MPDTAQFALERLHQWGGKRVIRFEQAQKLAMALPGDPHSRRSVTESVTGEVAEFLSR